MLINGHLEQEQESEMTGSTVVDFNNELGAGNSTVVDLKPKHFSPAQLTKLEEAFGKQTSPDIHRLHVLAMESNLTFADVQAWFKLRRLKWIQDIGKRTPEPITLPSVDC